MLSSPISPVTAAGLQGPTRYLAIPSTTVCPECAYSDRWTLLRCPDCQGERRVPLEVKVGDRLTVPISDELPEPRWVTDRVLVRSTDIVIHQDDGSVRYIDLWFGGSFSGTVAAWPDSDTAALPILALDLVESAAHHDETHLCVDGTTAVLWRSAGTAVDVSAELPWQDFCPGDQVVLLDDVTVTP